MTVSPDAQQLVALLSDSTRAVRPRAIDQRSDVTGRAGMYSWWGDDSAREVIGSELRAGIPSLLYVGQAGATKWPSGTRSTATLGSRIAGQHVRGNVGSSTFRLTIAALLMNTLGLVVSNGRLDRASNARVSTWIAEHLSVVLVPVDDRDTLGAVEAEVVRALDPPLNLGHCLPTHAREHLTELRRLIRRS